VEGYVKVLVVLIINGCGFCNSSRSRSAGRMPAERQVVVLAIADVCNACCCGSAASR
jgi:hypothetical protein